MRLQLTTPFSLRDTLECGQVFRWQRADGGYLGVVNDVAVAIRQPAPDTLECSTSHGDSAFIRRYFRLDDDYDMIMAAIAKDDVMKKAIDHAPGLHLIRQNPWECLISYITSSFSNIPRICGCIEALARRFGTAIDFEGKRSYAFPTVDALAAATEAEIRACGLGYRAAYIHQTAKKIGDGAVDLESLRTLPYDEAKKALRALPGVGDKVADCVLLFSLDHLDAFPVDVWIARIMRDAYFKNDAVAEKKIAAFGRTYFGAYAGYAQQYLYYAARGNRDGC